MSSFRAAAASHVGLVRETNEDSGFAGPGLVLVADGMGGHAAGEVASATAAYVLVAEALHDPEAPPGEALVGAVTRAQRQIAQGQAGHGRAGMATTVTAVRGDGNRFALLQLGDSRAYVLREGRLSRLSRDHTVVQEMVEAGTLQASEVRGHRWSHIVTRSLSGVESEQGDLVELSLQPGDRLLLCSDGLSDLVEEAALEWLLVSLPDDQQAVDALVQAALEAGGRDNVTCVVATVVADTPRRWDGQLVGAGRDPRLVVDPAAVRFTDTA